MGAVVLAHADVVHRDEVAEPIVAALQDGGSGERVAGPVAATVVDGQWVAQLDKVGSGHRTWTHEYT